MSQQILRRLCRSSPLLNLKQGSTLSIRSSPLVRLQLIIEPQWREDGNLSLEQTFPRRKEGEGVGDNDSSDFAEVEMKIEEGFQQGAAMVEKSGNFTSVLVDLKNNTPGEKDRPLMIGQVTLTAKIPEKCNLSCHFPGPFSDINITSKLECDFANLDTTGNIHLNRLRGHDISLSARNIHAKSLVEGQNVTLMAKERVRCKMIHGGNVDIGLSGETDTNYSLASLDDDDALALVDVSSLYSSNSGNGTNITVRAAPRKKVRIKSHHGHVSVQTFPPLDRDHETSTNLETPEGETSPVVELGGANGSFDILVHDGPCGGGAAARVHIDSLSPANISLVAANKGDVNVTVDRKVEVEVRLLSSPQLNSERLEKDVETLTSDDDENVAAIFKRQDEEMKLQTEENPPERGNITISTEAFVAREEPVKANLRHIRYIRGNMENKSKEMDSRFDVKLRGKINVSGAAAQALDSFTAEVKRKDNADPADDADLPLIAVATSGNIVLESLSWFGAIARRYDVKEESGPSLGRQATKSVKRKEDSDS